tara:strand:- start:347 stop:715 length:369 start_codon:yes stop_codon:yes gene_type:complete
MKPVYLRQRVTAEARTETGDDHGGFTESWTAVSAALTRMSAKVLPLVGRDLERARQVDPRISHEVTLRYWASFVADLAGGRARLVYHPTSTAGNNRTLEIVTPPVDIEEAHRFLLMQCRESA